MAGWGTGLANAVTKGAVGYVDEKDQLRKEEEAKALREQLLAFTNMQRGIVPASTSVSTETEGTGIVQPQKPFIDPSALGVHGEGAAKTSPLFPQGFGASDMGPPATPAPSTPLTSGASLTPKTAPLPTAPAAPKPPIPKVNVTNTPAHYDPNADPQVARALLRAQATADAAKQRQDAALAATAKRDSVNHDFQLKRDSTNNVNRKAIALGSDNTRKAIAGMANATRRDIANQHEAGATARAGGKAPSPYDAKLMRAVQSGVAALEAVGDPKTADVRNIKHLRGATMNVIRADPELRAAYAAGKLTDDMVNGAIVAHDEKNKETRTSVQLPLMKQAVNEAMGDAGTTPAAAASAPARGPAPKSASPTAPTIVPTDQEMQAALDAGITDYDATVAFTLKHRQNAKPPVKR